MMEGALPIRVTNEIARRLRVLRRTQHLTQEAAAELLECSLPTYRQLEAGSRSGSANHDPKLSTVMRALVVLGLDEPVVDVISGDRRK